MHRLNGPRRAVAAMLAVAAAAAVGVAGCGGSSGSSSSASTSSGGGSKGMTVHAAEFTWSAAAVTNAILQQITAQHPELGVSKFEQTQLDPAPAWAGAQRGDIDLLTEVALPNQQPLADKAKSKVSLVSQTYGNAAQGWFVPSYAVAPGGPLAGLQSVTQLNKYSSALGGKLYDADPGWVSSQQNTKRLKGYGLSLQHVTSGEAAELAQLKRAYDRKQPIVLYLYHPHWVFAQYKMTQLKEPAPYKPNCFTSGNGACAMPAYAAWVAAGNDIKTGAPKFYALLKKFRIALPEMEQMLAKVDLKKEPAEQVAKEWISQHSQDISSWISSS